MVDLPKLTPADKDKMPESIDAQNIQVTHTPWFVSGTPDKVKAGSTPSPAAVGTTTGAIQDKDIVVEDDWLKTKVCPHITKINISASGNVVTVHDPIEFVLIDYTQRNLKHAEVKRTSALATQTITILTKNQVSYLIMDSKGVVTAVPIEPIDMFTVNTNIENQRFLITVVFVDSSGHIVNTISMKNPEHPTGKYFPGQLNWMLTQIGAWQRNIVPEIHGKKGQAGTQFISAADIHGAFIGGLTRNPRPDDLGGSGFSHIAIPVKVNSKAFVSVVSGDDHKIWPARKAMPSIRTLKQFVNNGSLRTMYSNSFLLHPIYVRPVNYQVNYKSPVEIEFIIVLTWFSGYGIAELPIRSWMLSQSLDGSAPQPSVSDFAALCGFLVVKSTDTDITDTNIITAHQGLSALNRHITPMPVVQADSMPIPTVHNNAVSNIGLAAEKDRVMPYISSFKQIQYAYLFANPLKKAVLSYKSSTNSWSLKALNYTLSQPEINDFLTNSGLHGFVCMNFSSIWINGTIGVTFTKFYDFLAKIFGVADQGLLKFARHNMHVKYRALNDKIDYIYNSNDFENISVEKLAGFATDYPRGNLNNPIIVPMSGGGIPFRSPQSTPTWGGWSYESHTNNEYDYSGYFVDDKNTDNLLPRISVFPEIQSIKNVQNLPSDSNALAVSSSLSSWTQERDKRGVFKTEIQDSQYLSYGDSTPPVNFAEGKDQYTVTFLSRLPNALTESTIRVSETEKITKNASYLTRLAKNGIPVLSSITTSIAVNTNGSNVFTYSTATLSNSFMQATFQRRRYYLWYRTFIYSFGVTNSPLTPIKVQNLELDITLEALL